MNLSASIFFNENNKLSKNLKILLTIHTLFSIGIGLSNIFLNIFIWKYTKSFAIVMQYNLIGYVIQPFTFILGGWISKKKGLRNNLILGMICYSLFFIFILMIKTNIINYILLIGAMRGISSGFYYLSFNVLGYDYSSNQNRDYFFGVLGTVGSTVHMLAPLIAGYIITLSGGLLGYILIFTISFVLFLVGAIISFYLDNNHHVSKYQLLSVLKLPLAASNWTRIMFAEFFRGMRDDKVISTVISILVFIIAQKESSIGNYSFWTFLAGLISCYIAGLIINPNNRLKFMLFGVICSGIVSSIFLFSVDIVALWIFGIITSIFMNFVYIPHNSGSYAVIGAMPDKNEKRIEAIIVKEIFLNAGRIISYLVLALISSNNNSVLIFLFILGLIQVGIWIMHKKVDIITIKPHLQKPSILKQQKFLQFGKLYYSSYNMNYAKK